MAALVRGTITCLKPDKNSQLFAIVRLGNGISVFVPPKLLRHPDVKNVHIRMVLYLNHGGGRRPKATHVQLNNVPVAAASETGVAWESWQTGSKQIMLPDTVPGSCHDGIDLGCATCGAPIARGGDIHKVKGPRCVEHV